VRSWGLSAQEQDEVWARWRQGESLRLIARRLGKRRPSVRAFVLQTGGVQQHPPRRASRCLSMAEREEISRGVAAGEPCRKIAESWAGPVDGVAGAGQQRRPLPLPGSPLMGQPTAGSSDPNLPSWCWSRGCGRWWRPSWPCGGRRSRSPAGCRWPTLPIRCCGCRTRPSTFRCSCRAGGAAS
jgi:hypothetical protein